MNTTIHNIILSSKFGAILHVIKFKRKMKQTKITLKLTIVVRMLKWWRSKIFTLIMCCSNEWIVCAHVKREIFPNWGNNGQNNHKTNLGHSKLHPE